MRNTSRSVRFRAEIGPFRVGPAKTEDRRFVTSLRRRRRLRRAEGSVQRLQGRWKNRRRSDADFRFAAAQRTTVKGPAVPESETPEWKMVRFDKAPA